MFMATHRKLKLTAFGAIAASSLFFGTQTAAEIHELSRAELRSAVQSDRAIGTRRMIAGIEDFTQGDVMEVRAYLVDNIVMYRAMYRDADGTMRSLIVDATNGHAVSENSVHGSQVATLARQTLGGVGEAASNRSRSTERSNAASDRGVSASSNRNENGTSSGSNSGSSSSRNDNAGGNSSSNSNSSSNRSSSSRNDNASSNSSSNSGRDNNNRGGNGNSGGNGKGQGRNN